MKTRAFKSGNSQAVRIPADMAYDDMNEELEITRSGDVILIRPARGSLTEAVAILRSMPIGEPIGRIEPIELPERKWDK